MLSLALISLCLMSAALGELLDPSGETAIANLPTSSNQDDRFEYTNGKEWIPVGNKTSVEFTDSGIAGWRIAGDESSEVTYNVREFQCCSSGCIFIVEHIHDNSIRVMFFSMEIWTSTFSPTSL